VTAANKIVVFVSLVLSSVAFAQAPTPADAAFKRGRELLKAGKFADACVEFEHSNKLDPANGTAFNIAQCSEKIGKLARALELYRDLAAKDTNAERKKQSSDAIVKLEPRVPHLLVKVAAPPANFTMTIQVINSGLAPKALEANKPIEIDFGEYAIVAKAPGSPEWTQNVRIDTEGKTTTLDAPFGPKASVVDPKTTTTTTTPKTTAEVPITKDPDVEKDDPSPPKSNRKLFGIIGMGVGGAALIGGVIFGAQASSKWKEAKDVCGGTTCTNQADLMMANDLGDKARSKATLSTVFVIAGTAIAAGGVVLFVTAPKPESSTRVSAYPTNGGAGVTLARDF